MLEFEVQLPGWASIEHSQILELVLTIEREIEEAFYRLIGFFLR